MKVKIEGGTARLGEPSLCLSCRSASVVRGQRDTDCIIQCQELSARVGFSVTSCSEYVHHNHPSRWDLEQIAWILKTDLKRNQIGFVRPRMRIIEEE